MNLCDCYKKFHDCFKNFSILIFYPKSCINLKLHEQLIIVCKERITAEAKIYIGKKSKSHENKPDKRHANKTVVFGVV